MKGLDSSPVQVGHALSAAGLFFYRPLRIGGRPLQGLPDTVPQFRRRGLSEGDSRHSVQRGAARGYQRDDAVHQARCLAGSRARFHEEILFQRLLDAAAYVLVLGNE